MFRDVNLGKDGRTLGDRGVSGSEIQLLSPQMAEGEVRCGRMESGRRENYVHDTNVTEKVTVVFDRKNYSRGRLCGAVVARARYQLASAGYQMVRERYIERAGYDAYAGTLRLVLRLTRRRWRTPTPARMTSPRANGTDRNSEPARHATDSCSPVL